jgi:hypothetical protein
LETCPHHPHPQTWKAPYCPISLLSSAVKILERLLLPFLNPPSFPLSSSQHGFCPFRSTTSVILPIVTAAANGFNQKKPPTRTAIVALDISKAFDAVNHTLLLKQLLDDQPQLNSNVVRWLAVYLRGRKAKCLFRSSTSPSLIIHSGVPQGSVLSPSLFNIFVSDFPSQASITLSFADDFYIGESAPDLASLTSALNDDLALVEAWADAKKLTIAPEKSSILLLTPDPHQSKTQLQVFYKGSLVPLNKNPKYLGNVVDTHLNSTPHGNDIQPHLDRRVQIII